MKNIFSTSIPLSANGELSRTIRISVFIFIVYLGLFLPELSADSKLTFPDSEPQISMDFQDVNLKDILKVFSIQSGLNFIASEGVQERKITLYLDKVPLKMAMDKLFKANNLSYELDREANIFIVKDWGKLQVETITRIFYLKHATVSSSSLREEMSKLMTGVSSSFSVGGGGAGGAGGGGGTGKWKAEEDTGITKTVKKLISKDGSVIEDFRTNSLIVTDTPNRMEVIAQVIASLDVRVPQVILEVEMLDVSKNVIDKMGFNFAEAGSFAMQVVSASRGTNFPLGVQAPEGAGKTFTPGTISFPTTLKLVFDFLSTQTDTKFLARPKLLTLNNETAEIRIATNEAIGVTQSQSGAQGAVGLTNATAERSETGVILRVTPQINLETGEVTMFIYPKVAEAVKSSISSALGSFRDPEERSTKSLVRIKDGETVIIGGLIRNESTNIVTKVPILGDLPIIGALFRQKGGGSTDSPKNKERELLVFITPHIVKDADMLLAQAKKLTLPEREQNTASGINRESAINAGLNSFEKKNR